MSKGWCAPLACLAGSAGHRPRKPSAGEPWGSVTRSWLRSRCPPGSEATVGADPCKQGGLEQGGGDKQVESHQPVWLSAPSAAD